MAVKLTKDFDKLIETYEDDLNEEMILKGPLRRGLVVQLHSNVGRTEYLKTAILQLHKWSIYDIHTWDWNG